VIYLYSVFRISRGAPSGPLMSSTASQTRSEIILGAPSCGSAERAPSRSRQPRPTRTRPPALRFRPILAQPDRRGRRLAKSFYGETCIKRLRRGWGKLFRVHDFLVETHAAAGGGVVQKA
jgi:hypothetical protein